MKSLIAVLGMLILLTSLPTTAQQGGKRLGPGSPERQMAPKQVPVRDAAELQSRDPHHDKRMTPEQRRQLRRDVHNHGRDIYRDRPAPKP